MTLIVGIKCQGGCVVGADGAATTYDDQMNPTSEIPIGRKVEIVARKVVIGFAGHPGIGQIYSRAISTACDGGLLLATESPQAGEIVRQAVAQQLQPTLADVRKAFGPQGVD